MNTFQIKVLAIVTMIIDHMGLFFFPQLIIFRIIGRLSFPLFAWLIANGAYHTHDIGKYLQRLFIFALLSQIPYLLANRLINPHFSDLNVLCTLYCGLLAIALIQKTNNRILWVMITISFSVLAQFIHVDYYGLGVVEVVIFYIFYKNFKNLVLAQFLLFLPPLFLFPVYVAQLFEPLGLLSLLIIRMYNFQPGPRAKYLFYIFFPLQYAFYYLVLKKYIDLSI